MTEKRVFDLSDMTIEAWPVSRPKEAPDNHKNHTEDSVMRLAKSLADLGQIQPIIVDKDGEIIAGHGRLRAAKSLGWEKIKVIQVPVDRDTAIKARIADNLMSNQNIDNAKIIDALKSLDDIASVDMSSLFHNEKQEALIENALQGIDSFDETSISTDVSSDVTSMQQESDDIMETLSEAEVSVTSALGFAKVKPDEARILKDLMALAKHDTGQNDAKEALVTWARGFVE